MRKPLTDLERLVRLMRDGKWRTAAVIGKALCANQERVLTLLSRARLLTTGILDDMAAFSSDGRKIYRLRILTEGKYHAPQLETR